MSSLSRVGDVSKAGAGGFFSLFSAIWHKIGWRWGFTACIILIIMGSAIAESIEQRSPVIFVEELGSQIILSDHQLEVRTKEIIENPQEVNMDTNIVANDPNVVWYKRPFVYLGNALHNLGIKLKYYFARFSVFFRLIINIWFIYMFAWVLFKFAEVFITRNECDRFGSWTIAIILLVLFQAVFSGLTYDKPNDWNSMSIVEKGEAIMPFRGTIFMLGHLGDLFKYGKTNVADSIHPPNITGAVDIVNNKNGVMVV